ncbi:thiamine pyrophosphate enzyme [Colletotrichum tofieldiae]|nr:thiamine pyrophosphate enzyme [Colletotrichum tofieldiae]
MSMADGFARVTGKPQCVLVHFDVGTQMLGCAVHDASVARCPVFIFAGLDQAAWKPVAPSALPHEAMELIAATLAVAEKPLIIVGYTGRNHATVFELVQLAKGIPGIRMLDALGSDMCFPHSHRTPLGVRIDRDASIEEADVILIVDCEVGWISTRCRPRFGTKIIHIDVEAGHAAVLHPRLSTLPGRFRDRIATIQYSYC